MTETISQDWPSVVSSLCTNFLIAAVTFCAFGCLRPTRRWLYAPRVRGLLASEAPRSDDGGDAATTQGQQPHVGEMHRRAAPPLPEGYFGWISTVLHVSDEDFVTMAGLDAFVFVTYTRTCARIFSVALLLVAVVVAPSNAWGDAGLSGIGAISMQNVPAGSQLLWVQVVAAYAMTYVALSKLGAAYVTVLAARLKYVARPEPQHYACLALRLPQEVTDGGDSAAHAFFSSLYPDSYAWSRVVRRTPKLDSVVDARELAVSQLERAEYDWHEAMRAAPTRAPVQLRPRMRTGLMGVCGPEVDTITHLRSHIMGCNAAIREAQDSMQTTEERIESRVAGLRSTAAPLGADAGRGNAGTDVASSLSGAAAHEDKPTDSGGGASTETPTAGGDSGDPRGGAVLAFVSEGAATAASVAATAGKEVGLNVMHTAVDLRNDAQHVTGMVHNAAMTTVGVVSDLMGGVAGIEFSPKGDDRLTRCAVVAFKTLAGRNMAAQAIASPSHTPQLVPAPEPRDVYWRNLAFTAKERDVRYVLVYVGVAALVLLISVPVAAIASLTTLSSISQHTPWLYDVIKASPALEGFLEGFLPSVGLLAVMALLPGMLLSMSKAEGLRSMSALQAGVLRKFFLFQLFNAFLTSSITSTVVTNLDRLSGDIVNPIHIAQLLGTSMPGVAVSFVNYVMLQALSAVPLELLQVGRLVVGSFKLRFSAKTHGEVQAIKSAGGPNYGWTLPQMLLVFMIGMTYSTMQPLMVLFCAMFFAVANVVWRHQLLYVYDMPYHSAGSLWKPLFARSIVGILVFQLMFLGVLPLFDASAMAGVLLPLPVLTLVYYKRCDSTMGVAMDYLPVSLCRDADSRAKAGVAGAKVAGGAAATAGGSAVGGAHVDLGDDADTSAATVARVLAAMPESFTEPSLLAPQVQLAPDSVARH